MTQDCFFSRDDKNKLVQNIVMEFVDQSLEDLLQEKVKRQGFFKEFETKLYVYQILQALADLHSMSRMLLTRHCAQGSQA